jgi:probable rRNA maturation factor
MSIDLDLQIACDDENLPSQAFFQRVVENVLQPYQKPFELTIRLVTPEESAQLNGQYRQKPKPTNVLSFPFEAPPEISLPLLGDLVICANVVANEAKEQNKTLEAHWAHMVTHGCLHLLGYDHINEPDAQEMESLEISLLAQLGYDDPYQLA